MTRTSSSDISLRELVLKVQDYLAAIIKRWMLLCILGFGLAFLFLFLNWGVKPIYKADLTFMLNEDDRGGLGGLASMLGQFGLSGGSSESNFDRIVELSKTRRIAQQALFTSKNINGKEDYIANHYIDNLKDLDLWNKKGVLGFLSSDDDLDLEDFRFSSVVTDSFSLIENKALKSLHIALVGKDKFGNDLTSDYDELTGILTLSMRSGDPNLSIDMVNSFYDNLSDYYLEKTVQKHQANYIIIKSKYDSIAQELVKVQTSLALVKDSSIGVFREQDKKAERKLREDELRLQTILVEAEKNKAIAELTLDNKTTYIDEIDKPIPPLRPVNKGRIYYFLLGGFLGGIIGLIWIISQKAYREIMSV